VIEPLVEDPSPRKRGKARRREANIRLVAAFLSENPCVDCEENDPEMLEFDHVQGEKRTEVSNLAQQGYSWRAIFREIRKCQVRCVMCHRRKTNAERKQKKAAQ